MRSSYVIGSLALAASNALASPQAVTSAIAPKAPAPAGCSKDHSGQFQITVVNVTSSAKPKQVKRAALEINLSGGVLKDALGRTGYIASNFQFQFDGPPQAGSIYTAGFSLCNNGTLALGNSAIWYQCLSGGFYNLYDRHWAAQCSPIYIEAIGFTSGPALSEGTDGQVSGTSVSQQGDGQVIATSTPISQIGDGQIQNPASQISDGQIQAPKAIPVSQLPDGQIQANPPAAPVSQISDGQVQVPNTPAATGKPAGQGPNGQVDKPTASPVTQISDGQIQASQPASPTGLNKTSPGGTASQIPDGQPQVNTPTKAGSNATGAASSRPSQVAVSAASALQMAGSAAFAGLAAVLAALL